MKRFIEGEDRVQATLFPEQLDDYIAEENSVRVIDVFVDELDLSKMGFKTVSAQTGRPSYHPATMLKLYIYGYLNRVQSSRRLERESQRNVELMWLLGRLAPDFKTIADFRKDNTKSIVSVCREFVVLCRKLNLFSEAFVAIDGSKFKAVNSRERNFTKAKLKKRLEQLDASIAKYLKQIETTDRRDGSQAKLNTRQLNEKIASLKEKVKDLNELKVELEAAPDKQISLTDADARSMKTRSTKSMVGYNVQSAVDIKNHLIVAHEVTNIGSDRGQLSYMCRQAKDAIGAEALKAAADKGYYKGEEILACEEENITAFVPKCLTSGNKAKGLFDKSAFVYQPDTDTYKCPAGELAPYRTSYEDKGRTVRRYWSSACPDCPLKSQCTTGKQRRINRWEHEAVLDAMEERLQNEPDMMTIRKSTVEHPFGTIKSWMGATHFQMKTLEKVSTEMSLHVLAYNLKRVMSIMGTKPLIEAMRA